MPRKKIQYNYFHNGKSITKQQFLSGISANSDNWKRKCVRDRWGSYSCGYYHADPKD